LCEYAMMQVKAIFLWLLVIQYVASSRDSEDSDVVNQQTGEIKEKYQELFAADMTEETPEELKARAKRLVSESEDSDVEDTNTGEMKKKYQELFDSDIRAETHTHELRVQEEQLKPYVGTFWNLFASVEDVTGAHVNLGKEPNRDQRYFTTNFYSRQQSTSSDDVTIWSKDGTKMQMKPDYAESQQSTHATVTGSKRSRRVSRIIRDEDRSIGTRSSSISNSVAAVMITGHFIDTKHHRAMFHIRDDQGHVHTESLASIAGWKITQEYVNGNNGILKVESKSAKLKKVIWKNTEEYSFESKMSLAKLGY